MKTFTVYGLAVLTLIGLTAGQSKYCCSIPQFEGEQSFIIGNTVTNVYMYYDATNRRIAGFMNSTGLNETFFLQISTTSGGKSYSLDLKTRRCNVEIITDPFTEFCVPDNFTKTGDIFLGTSLNPLRVSTYHLVLSGDNYAGEAFMTVTADQQCVPVSAQVTSDENGGKIRSVFNYFNIRPGISRPSVFDVPPECQNGSLALSQVHRRSAQIPGLFSPLLSSKQHVSLVRRDVQIHLPV